MEITRPVDARRQTTCSECGAAVINGIHHDSQRTDCLVLRVEGDR